MKRALAHAKAVAERRRAGERVGLLVVSLHDWQGGLWFDGRPEVCRVVLPADLAVDDADWSVCLALDVVVCGSAPDAVFADAVRSVIRSGAVSCWGDFADGFSLLSLTPAGAVVAMDDPVPVSKLGAALRSYRSAALALRLGGYGSRVFDAARTAMFGPLLADLKSSLCGADQ